MAQRLLIAVGQAAKSAEDLPFGVRELIDASDEILVISPALATRFEWLASATDKAREQADERLGAVLGHLEELGSPASGSVGADDPMLAFEDALASFPAGHILVGLRAVERSGRTCGISSQALTGRQREDRDREPEALLQLIQQSSLLPANHTSKR